ncbi:glycosyltransferase family 25 protein [Nitratireductor aquimarinus]|uniref:glycosyltransferase family 25 protein n=1 Tax=Nitratireductor aquimarinus TaxID=889300 RepID=UPI002935EF88|nr:glycosyltransferase family 25 protein [Nitratireductor aquimarinus]MDV2964393.1 glycosyltransferase family 25 protein [Nitratireductor aquimarinus]
MKTLVINLERETSRLAHMRRVFGEQGLDFEVVTAVDASLLSPAELDNGRTGVPRFYELGAGEIACFLSHRKCWEIVAQSEDDYTVICEDDIFLGENAGAVFSDYGWIPANAGIVRLEACRPKLLVGTKGLPIASGRKLVELHEARAGAAAYILHRDLAGFLLEKTARFCDPVDQLLFNDSAFLRRGAHFYQVVPAIAIQECSLPKNQHGSLGSALQGERRMKRRVGLKKLYREVVRPFEQAVEAVVDMKDRFFSDRRWVRVPFR